MNEFQNIPSVDTLLQDEKIHELIIEYGRPLIIKAINRALDETREAASTGKKVPDSDKLVNRITQITIGQISPSLIKVINATGIILHTNLGRALLSRETITAMQAVSSGYSNLEYDLAKGKRGKREIHAEEVLKNLTDVESALVVNNNASAVLLILTALANRKRVVIANSQLVEIGGGFRIPDVMRQSGAKLIAIGTTNRVHLSDYQTALQEPAALVLTAHHSNYKIIGFTTEPDLKEIAAAAHEVGTPLVVDLGSGAFMDTADYGLSHEPTVQESLAAGADLVCFSGDKLLGGPQAGIIIGSKRLIDKIKKHPLARAVRTDKLCLAGISATLVHYLKNEAVDKIPVWKMISMETDQIKSRAEKWLKAIGQGSVITGKSMVGGGSLPTETLPTYLFALDVKTPTKFHKSLRTPPMPVISRIENDQILFDPRTVLVDDEPEIIKKIKSLLKD
jgi:L-seryl-tRNA(Ser) seleniumtransferase